MSVVLTGDVHHSIGGADQSFTDRSEAALALEYAAIAARHGLKVTLFFTGRAVVEDGDDARSLWAMDNVEIAGHGWNAFKPRLWHGMLSRVLGSPHGPAWLQQRMIRRTHATIERLTGRCIHSWRNHAYRCDRHTPTLLAAADIRAWSDEVNLERHGPYPHPSGVVVLPINTTPDHEYLRHGAWPRESVTLQSGGPSYDAEEWCARVCTQVESIARAGGVATVLAHPLCMKILDDWVTLDHLCRFLAKYRSLHAQEAVARPSASG
jgi:hypothetical protein